MDFLNYSVETLQGYEARATFTVCSSIPTVNSHYLFKRRFFLHIRHIHKNGLPMMGRPFFYV